MYRAVLDTCALVPSLQRDFLLQLATEDAFAPMWGTGILAELDYTLARLHEQRGIGDSEHRRSARRINPPQTPAQILDQLVERYRMHEVNDILRPLLPNLT
ncbi:MAG TPA: hypothetical protein IAA98_04395 [Candidatus Avipropionibacterium avicola]|uniref:PIN domain-containing protein n=1 Tax=Candidatus Avipropionibacterium avicola TaxID=2840701 RepID=A0A9D1GWR5_9ACTN|nr:hypothetical protein [Candidatus Avipropionibacterium avicola]